MGYSSRIASETIILLMKLSMIFNNFPNLTLTVLEIMVWKLAIDRNTIDSIRRGGRRRRGD